MIFAILAAIAALFVVKKGGAATAVSAPSQTGNLTAHSVPVQVQNNKGVAGVSTSVHKNSVGVSLSNALGNTYMPPGSYRSGGTKKQTPPFSSIVYLRPRHTTTRFVRTVSNPTGGSKTIPYAGGQTGQFTQNNPPKPHHAITTTQSGAKKITYSALVNPAQSPRPIQGPEQGGAFWTKLPYKRNKPA